MNMNTPDKDNNSKKLITGLILCGGESKRMGEPKALLKYHVIEQYLFVFNLIKPYCEQVFISCKSFQSHWFSQSIPQLHDDPEYTELGPIGAILKAIKLNKETAYLLMGCDYPLIEKEDIQLLVDTYYSANKSCCLYNPETNMEEPLLAIYHPNDFDDLLKYYQTHQKSLRFFLQQKSAIKIIPAQLSSIRSFDTREDFENWKIT